MLASNWIRFVTALSLALLVACTTAASPSNKWRLQFSGNAESDGVIILKLTPVGGEPLMVETIIAKGTSENGVAKAVVAACLAQLPGEVFLVEQDDGEDVLIKKARGAADFGVEIVTNTVKDVRIRPDRE